MNVNKKTRFFGDNLQILRDHIPTNTIDLIYLDPPFNSKSSYNILFNEPSGEQSVAQIHAFEDSWHWGMEAEKALKEILEKAPSEVVDMITAFDKLIKKNDMMAYLVMMTVRLLELHRVLKSTGSIYLHCDPTASHYLKIVMDAIFGKDNFRNEVVWKRTFAHNDPARFGRNDDRILFYTKTDKYYFNPVLVKYDESYVEDFFKGKDEKGIYQSVVLTGPHTNAKDPAWKGYNPSQSGRSWSIPKRIINKIVGEENANKMSTSEKLDLLFNNGYIILSKNGVPRFKQYLSDMEGAPAQEIWTDIPPLSAQSSERLGYQTQKPRALLERIIKASGPPEGVILDPFCGCGTTLSACEFLNQTKKFKFSWIGIDVTHLSINLMKHRLKDEYGLEQNKDYKVIGEPKDLQGAIELAKKPDRYDFQYWALSLVDARPYADKKKGADTGIDGYIYFIDSEKPDEFQKAIVQVKSGSVQVKDIRELQSVIEREKALIGVFITLESPTRPMLEESARAGLFKKGIPKIQILTVKEILENNARPNIPLQVDFIKRAEIVE